MAQFPLDMGRPGAAATGRTLALGVTADGRADFGALARQGAARGKLVATDAGAMLPKLDVLSEAHEKPTAAEEEATILATKAALDAVVAGKAAATQPKAVPKAPGAATYIKYTPSGDAAVRPGAVGSRVIKMQDMPVDPLQPPKFRHTRVPRGPGSPPAPVLHSPPKPVSKAEAADWKIPPCVSNWKNAKGYTIPLDKRLAADGRGLAEASINDGFATFAEALYVAEQTARQAVEMRAAVAREVAAQERERKEVELRELAAAARLDRVGPPVGGGGLPGPPPLPGGGDGGELPLPPPPPRGERGGGDRRESPARRRRSSSRDRGRRNHRSASPDSDADRRRRDEIRSDRRRARERERRLDAAAARGGPAAKKSKVTRDRDRDVSERVALGQAAVGGPGTGGEGLYDQRLFNQDAGVAGGLADDAAYNLYDKPLFADRGGSIYRPRRGGDEDGGGEGGAAASRAFKPDVGFAGADYSKAAAAAASGPVQFERDPKEADPFGLDDFVGAVSKGGKGKEKE